MMVLEVHVLPSVIDFITDPFGQDEKADRCSWYNVYKHGKWCLYLIYSKQRGYYENKCLA